MNTSYLPIDPDFFDWFEKEKENDSIKVVYFGVGTNQEEVNSKIDKIERKNGNAFFMKFLNGDEVRVDRIIVYNGKPGPAFDEYQTFANECLSCQAGYEE